MKKNFFKKKLASALALALVVASVSPVSASAATAAKIVDKGTSTATAVLYVDKVSYGKSAVNFDLSKTYAGTTYTWTVSDSKKATIGAKTGYVVAKAPGVVKVTVTAKKGKTTTKFTQSVTIRKRATAVEAGDDFTLNAGETKSLKATLTPSTSTDAVKYVSDKEAVATVDAKTGVVTAVGAGEATITVYAKAASSAPDTSKWNVSDTVKVKVNLGVSKVEQSKAAELKLTFNGDPTAVKTTDLSIVKDDTKQVIAVKSVSAKDKVLTVTTFADMTDGKVYTVTYGGKALQFTATDGVVASLSISPVTVPYETLTTVSVSTVDAKGIVLASYDYSKVTDSKLDFTISTTKGYTSAEKLLLGKIGDTAKATATYHTYKYDTTGNEVGAVKTEVTITAVDKTPITIANTKYTIAKTVPNWDKLTTTNTKLSVNDSDAYYLFFYAKDSTDTVKTSGYTFASSNTNVLLVGTGVSGNAMSASVKAVATGDAYVLVKDLDGKVVYSLLVNVVGERKAASLTLDKNSFILSNAVAVADTKDVTLTVKDQYDTKVATPYTTTVTAVSTTASGITKDDVTAANGYFSINSNGDVVTFNGLTNATTSTKEGTYVYKITVGDFSQYVTVTVKAPTADAGYYQAVVNTDSVDVNFDGSSAADKNIIIKLATIKGVVSSYANLKDITTSTTDADDTATSSVVIKNGNDVVTGAAIDVTATGTSITFKASKVVSGKVVKAATGSYSVVLVAADGTKVTTGFVVTDTQAGVSIVKDKASVTGFGTDVKAAVASAFKFYYDGTQITSPSIDSVDFVKATGSNDYYIKSITVNVSITGSAGSFSVPVKVNVGDSVNIQ